MAAADVNGTVSYTGLLKVFNDLDTKLGTTKLTAAEMADLKTIATNLNNGLSTSSYLTSITQALVNGNAAGCSPRTATTPTGYAFTSVAKPNM
jgi:hypothetical protein